MSASSKLPEEGGCVKDDHEYIIPKRAVLSMADMATWEKTEAHMEYVGFLTALNESVKGKQISSKYPESPNVAKIVDMLNKMEGWLHEFPPVSQPQRYGNQAFKSWFNKLKKDADNLLKEALPEKFHRAIPEIKEYLVEGFGNSTRIDYGTGHEMSFLFFVCCLFKIGVLLTDDKAAAVLKIFNRYVKLARKLQLTYRMEPAGSHGVWSLDDYQFVPFIWGSSQLVAHPRLEPKSFLQEEVAESNSEEFMFMACIDYINKVKTGPFAEHSNQLWNVSAVGNWSKVNQGLMKMYKAEVLNKFPVIQHVLFGSLMPFKIAEPSSTVRKAPIEMMRPPGAARPSQN